MRTIQAGLFFLCFTLQSFAREDLVPGSRWTSGRGAAMGDAIIGSVDDGASALFYNPAGLGSIRRFYVEPMNLTFMINRDTLSATQLTKITSMMNLSSFAPTLKENVGAMPGVGTSYFPNFVFRGFGFGVLFQARQSAQYTSDGDIHYKTRWELIPTAGFGLRLASGIFKIGYSLQYVNAAVGDITVPSSTDALSYLNGVSQGSAISHNVGVIFSLPVAYLPKFSAVARNVGSAKYRATSLLKVAKDPAGPPATERMTIDASFGLEPRLTRRSKLNMNFEYRDATNRSATPATLRFAMGFELAINDFLMLRTGFASGYPTMGLGIRRPRADINFSYYNEARTPKFRGDKETIYMFQYQARVF